MMKSFAANPSSERLCHTLEHSLHCLPMSNTRNSHLQVLGRNTTHTDFDVARNPLNREKCCAQSASACRHRLSPFCRGGVKRRSNNDHALDQLRTP
mmetsp:Transcript_40126/g.79348  ORF Transcript_40126/g.79348 Transcript_40126/m.79348 type:complete len:96 (-) Transcript_40126:143-430(-)